jgi:hypothetical protein
MAADLACCIVASNGCLIRRVKCPRKSEQWNFAWGGSTEAFMQRSEKLSNDGSRAPALETSAMTKKITPAQKWHQLSEAAKNEAEKLPHGKEREALLRRARQFETASQIDQWISSPALQPPT